MSRRLSSMTDSSVVNGGEHLKMILRRETALEEFHREKAEKSRIEKDEYICSEAKRIHSFWKIAALEASRQNGKLELSWNKELTFVDPFLYTFYETFGLHIYSLRLVSLSLTHLSDEFSAGLKHLEALSLANNQLKALPDNFPELTNLKTLNLLNNRLEVLPDLIGQMSSLCNLEIANNRISMLPNSFAALYMLIKVNLECNKLQILPENLDNMKSCKYLNVNNNVLSRLPRCLSKMPSLANFSACKNVISYIPSELFESKSLRILRLSANRIRIIPDNIGDMRKLKEFSLDFNCLLELPLSLRKLEHLKVLRVEGNFSLNDPPAEILKTGAQGVVAYLKDRVKNDEAGRIRNIVTSTQDCLQQALDTGIASPSEFQADSVADNDPDPWFAFQMPYFWATILPTLRETWRIDALQGKINTKYEVFHFPHTEREVMWAFANFLDAYGPVLKNRRSLFKKCSCTEKGLRRPCVPPRVGFMCERMCTMIKMKLAYDSERQTRLWGEYKKNSLADAADRARYEAESYLQSPGGKEWLAVAAFEQLNKILHADGGQGNKKGWRLRAANRRKKRIIRKYDKLLNKTKLERDASSARLKEVLSLLNEALLQPDTVPGGFVYLQSKAKIYNLTMRLSNMEEDVRLQRLLLMCEEECDKVDDFVFEQGEEASSEEDSALSDSSEETQSDGSEHQAMSDRKIVLLKQRGALAERSQLRSKAAEDIREAAVRARSFAPHDSTDRTLVPSKGVTAMSALWGAVQGLSTAASGAVQRAKRTFEEEFLKISHSDDEAEGVVAVDAVGVNPRVSRSQFLRKKLRRVKDVMEGRARRFIISATGNSTELVRELTHEYYQQYVKISVSEARDKAEREMFIIDNVRQNMSGIGVKVIFKAWHKWVLEKASRAKKDRDDESLAKQKDFSTALASVFIAEHHISLWKKCVDIYSDQIYWQHSVTMEVSVAEPSLHHYLPPHFIIPPAPTKTAAGDEDDMQPLSTPAGKFQVLPQNQTGMQTHRGGDAQCLTSRGALKQAKDQVALSSPLAVRSSPAASPCVDVAPSMISMLSEAAEGGEDADEDYNDDEDDDEYDEFDYLEQVDEDSDEENSNGAYRTSSMQMQPSQSVRSVVRMQGIQGLGSMDSRGFRTDHSRSGRSLVSRRLSRSGVGSDFISHSEDIDTSEQPNAQSVRRGRVFRSTSEALSMSHTGHGRVVKRALSVSQETHLLEGTAGLVGEGEREVVVGDLVPVIGEEENRPTVLLTPSQLSFALLSVSDNIATTSDTSPHPTRAQTAPQDPLTLPLSIACVPRTGIKGRIARALLRNTPAGDALVHCLRFAEGRGIPKGNALPLASYGSTLKSGVMCEVSPLKRSYAEAKAYLSTHDDSDFYAKEATPSPLVFPDIAIVVPSAADMPKEKSFRKKCDAEYFLAAKAVRTQREQSETARRRTYLRKPEKSRTLDAITAARAALAADEDWVQEKKRRIADADLKTNPFKYDLMNLQVVSGGALPSEHLLLLSAEGTSTQDIVKSNTSDMNQRTLLAYKAIKVSASLTNLAAKKGIIPLPPQKTWYQKEIAPLFHTRFPSSDSGSDSEGADEKEKDRYGRKTKKGRGRRVNNGESKEELRAAHDLRRKLKRDVKQEEIKSKEQMDAMIFNRLNLHHTQEK